MVVRLAGIGLRVEGRDNLPPGPCVVVANHRSYFDGLALICALPAGFSPMIKDAVRQIPVLGRVMARAGSLYVRRTPAREAGLDTLRVIRRVRGGVSPAVFAEGTLSPDHGLLPLRDGAFLIAARAGLPVVPVAIQGSDNVLPSGGRRLRCGRITVRIGQPLSAAGRDWAAGGVLRDRIEHALWGLLSPATASWRSTLCAADYYAKALSAYTDPAVVIDLDTLSACLRSTLRRLPSKPLRFDARVLGDAALARRIWRSDVRINAVLFDCVGTAKDWVNNRGFDDALIAPPTIESKEAAQMAMLAAETRRVAVAVSHSADLAALEHALQDCRRSLVVWARVTDSGAQSCDAAIQQIQTIVDVCRKRSVFRLGGILIEPAQLERQSCAGGSAADVKTLIERAATITTPVSVLGATTSMAIHRLRCVNEVVFGQELEQATPADSSGWVFAGRTHDRAGRRGVMPIDVRSLRGCRERRIDLYGGSIVADQAAPREQVNVSG
ncbi:hypothetical protein HKX42_01355 [Salinisphaera sp. USBA-960]|uniref:1-acyl-sn-glycerol-3-phosphate acyltransferase n=1 Tax=Salinisphaera orenii TaxID=856731 RepID=UPI0013A612BD|nr:hypothetical protein [Salifodinibacter halophilus]NNC25524.1 hypothetical protein [Salifodinibacter halophilus]